MIQSPALAAVDCIRHGFFTRTGGVSTGIYGSLNCGFGSNDERKDVAENRARCAARLHVARNSLITAYQVHGITVATVDTPWAPGDAPKADAMVTRRPGIALGILTADCAPVLFADEKAGVIGAAHAGWKGAKAGVVQATVEAMTKLGAEPSRIIACIGPSIGLSSYEVGEEFRDGFLADDAAAVIFFRDGGSGRPHFDLGGFVAARLRALGLAAVGQIGADTCADAQDFFSYRRTCLAGETDYGRQISTIALA